MYSDYSFYTNSFGGALTEAEYLRFSVRASAEIDRMTSQCAVIDELSYQSIGGSGDVTSESNDGVSKSYATGAVAKSSRQRIDAAAYTWLCNTNLLFCGI